MSAEPGSGRSGARHGGRSALVLGIEVVGILAAVVVLLTCGPARTETECEGRRGPVEALFCDLLPNDPPTSPTLPAEVGVQPRGR